MAWNQESQKEMPESESCRADRLPKNASRFEPPCKTCFQHERCWPSLHFSGINSQNNHHRISGSHPALIGTLSTRLCFSIVHMGCHPRYHLVFAPCSTGVQVVSFLHLCVAQSGGRTQNLVIRVQLAVLFMLLIALTSCTAGVKSL